MILSKKPKASWFQTGSWRNVSDVL